LSQIFGTVGIFKYGSEEPPVQQEERSSEEKQEAEKGMKCTNVASPKLLTNEPVYNHLACVRHPFAAIARTSCDCVVIPRESNRFWKNTKNTFPSISFPLSSLTC
jgi:hypothetical protein